MKLKIRYENAYQTIEVSEADKDKLWISLSLEGEGLTSEEQEKKIQQAFEERFNRPEYNNWHKFDRHRGESRAKPGKDETDADIDTAEPFSTRSQMTAFSGRTSLPARSRTIMKKSASGFAVRLVKSRIGRMPSSRSSLTACP